MQHIKILFDSLNTNDFGIIAYYRGLNIIPFLTQLTRNRKSFPVSHTATFEVICKTYNKLIFTVSEQVTTGAHYLQVTIVKKNNNLVLRTKEYNKDKKKWISCTENKFFFIFIIFFCC